MNRIFVLMALIALTFVATIGVVGLSKFSAQQASENARSRLADSQEKPSIESTPAGPISVTKQAFEAIKWGMPEVEVRKIMGGEGFVQSDSGRIKIVTFREGSKLIGVTYRDGRLAGKTQVGL